MSELPRTIAIVGAGFSGMVVAANLLSHAYPRPLRILLIDRSRITGGIAYAERDFPYLLNVPASRMSANSHAPLEFLEFARRRFPDATAQDFLPRELYGQYLEWKLLSADALALPHIELARVQGQVDAIFRDSTASPFMLQLVDGRTFRAHQLVLAVGNASPAQLPETATLLKSGRYVANPWRMPAAAGTDETVLLVGTGLTMADVALATATRAAGRVRIHALSRHGWLPASQPSPQDLIPPTGGGGDGAVLLKAATISARQLYSAVINLTNEAQARGSGWHDAINCVRQHAPALWHRLPMPERRRFLRHLRTLWDVHRHRLPQATSAALNQLRARGVLQVHAGRLQQCQLVDRQIRVSWRPRGSSELSSLNVDRIINCTGANHDVRYSRDPLWSSLLSQGLISPDPLGLGLRTGPHGAVINARGAIVENLFYVGPLLQASHWEATAVLELRGHAEGLARHLMAPRRERMVHFSTTAHPPAGISAPQGTL